MAQTLVALRNLNQYQIRLWLKETMGSKAFALEERYVLASAHKVRCTATNAKDEHIFTDDERLTSELWLKGNGFTTEI